ncbi:hypothetical protein ElyMa_005613600 [Elysia marginata]|uniref:Uncharacterized protein n=1 Tax=Elysia marginata TaxID=1093978 RepID=A0AAV4F7G9_9GAST|nr:hypothetical protein ElyMa_005613600 [Elysia marginata]
MMPLCVCVHKTTPLALRASDTASFFYNQKPALAGREDGQNAHEKRPETSVGRSRGGLQESSNVISGQVKQPPPDHIPVIICDEINEGDTPSQSRGSDRGVSPDNNFLQHSDKKDNDKLYEKPLLNLDQQAQDDRSSRRRSSQIEDLAERIPSARSRKGSAYGQGFVGVSSGAIGKAVDRYLRGPGFDPQSGLNFICSPVPT